MSLSQFLKTNMASLLAINSSMVCLLVILQLAAWYPVLSEENGKVDRHIKHKDRALSTWKKIQKQSNVIESDDFMQTSWVTHKTQMKEQNLLTQWQIEGRASITEWQVLLEQIQEQFALGLMEAYWEKGIRGDWYGRLSFDIQSPKANREYDNWLPTKLHAGHFAEKDWRVLSTMRVGKYTSALLEYKDSRHWVRQGSWLPTAGLTVDAVSFDQVTLMAKDGSQVALRIRKAGEEHD